MKFVCIFALLHIIPAGAVRVTLPRLGHLRPAKLSESKVLSEKERLAVAAKTDLGEEADAKTDPRTSTKARKALRLRVPHKDIDARSSQEQKTSSTQKTTESAEIDTNSLPMNFFQVEMEVEKESEEHHVEVEEPHSTIGDVGDFSCKLLMTLLGFVRFQDSDAPEVKFWLGLVIAIVLFMMMAVVLRSCVHRRKGREQATEMDLLEKSVPDLQMYSANLEQKKVLEKMLREGVGAWDLKMLRRLGAATNCG